MAARLQVSCLPDTMAYSILQYTDIKIDHVLYIVIHDFLGLADMII